MGNINVISDLTSGQIIADVSESLITTLATNPITSWVGMEAAATGNEIGKFLWPEHVLSETSTTLSANYTAASGTMTVVSTAAYRVGDQIVIENNVDGDFRKQAFRISAIPGGTTLTVVHNTNSGTDTSITSAAAGNIHRASSVEDNFSDITNVLGTATEPTIENNIFQTFQTDLELGQKTIELASNGFMMGVNDLVTFGIQEKLFDISYQMYNQLLRGYRRDEAAAIGGTFGGISDFVNTAAADNRVTASAGALTEDLINDLLEKLILRGLPQGSPMLLIMSPTNARVLSGLRNNVVAPMEFQQNTALGGNVQIFYAELPGYGGMQILVDPNLEDATVYMINTDDIGWVPKLNAIEPLSAIIDGTLPGQKGKRWFIRSTISCKIAAATRRHGVIYNIVP